MPRRQTILWAKEANNTCHIGHHVNASESYHPHFPELTPRRQIIEHRPPPGSFMPRRHIILHRPKTSWECYVYKSPLMLIFALMPQRQTIPFEVLPRFFEVLFAKANYTSQISDIVLNWKFLFRSEHGRQEKTSVETDKPNPFWDSTSREGESYFTDLGYRANASGSHCRHIPDLFLMPCRQITLHKSLTCVKDN